MADENEWTGEITLVYGDDERPFRLKIEQLIALEEKTGLGVGAIHGALVTGNWSVPMVRETLRLGLIGGGMGVPEAKRLVDRYSDTGRMQESFLAAFAVLQASLMPPPVDAPAAEAA